MKIKRIEHVGIVVRNVEASRKLWEDCFGIPLGSVEQIAERPVKLALYPVGESMVELISGTTPDSKHAKMIAEGKGGLNHICFEVEDIDAASKKIVELGGQSITPVHDSPFGRLGLFVDSTGALFKLMQR